MATETNSDAAETDAPGAIEAEPRRRSPLRWALQLAAVALVAALLALLVSQLVSSDRDTKLVSSIKHAKKPPAPAFTLPVIWAHPETWPRRLRPALADGNIALAELRGYSPWRRSTRCSRRKS